MPKNQRLLIQGLLITLVGCGLAMSTFRSHAVNPTLAERVQAIVSQPQFRQAMFGVEFYSLTTGKVIYQLNGEKLFVPASTTKLLTEGTALHLLGPDFRFHTPVYRTGPISADGTLKGDLVLVASGDPNLSGRIRPDGTLAFENVDHTYGGSPDTRAVPGDPLLVIHQLAKQVASAGIKHVEGRVLVDTGLFPGGEKELGTGMVISPIVVNDNIVDVTAYPGNHVGAPVRLAVSPLSDYVKFDNRATTGPPESQPDIEWADDVTNPNGSHIVTVTGSMPLGKPSILWSYGVPDPRRFAEMTLEQALRQEGITIETPAGAAPPDFEVLSARYTPADRVAEHVSPPFSQDVKVTLKVSQNLHASLMPCLFGSLVAHQHANALQAGFNLEQKYLEEAGLSLSGASQSDGAGGAPVGCFTPDFMVHYLAFLTHQKFFPVFLKALPIMGHDGTLWNIQVHSPAAGHVQAKTGTLAFYDALNRNLMVTAKGLAGYITTPEGKRWAFAAYINHVAVPRKQGSIDKIAGQALGEIANAGYLAAVETEKH